MRRRVPDGAVCCLMRGATYGVVLLVVWMVAEIVWHGAPAMSWRFLTGFPERSGAEGGILPAIVGTLSLVGCTAAVALPLGMASAVYLSEYAGQGRFTAVVRVAMATLAGIPSVVCGLFGLGLFVVFLGFGTSILAGSLTLACLILPTIVVASEEALRAVPRAMREGSLALGASRWQTVWNNVLPYALPGMLTGSVLGIGRAAGETAPVLLTAAAFYLPRLPDSLFSQVMVLPYHLYILATQHPEATKVRPMQYATALTLLLLVLGVDSVAVVARSRLRRRHRW